MFVIPVFVIPAEAGIQASIQPRHPPWMQVFTGMSDWRPAVYRGRITPSDYSVSRTAGRSNNRFTQLLTLGRSSPTAA
jgi:hypothetical protein